MSALAIPYYQDYGASELKKYSKRFLTRGLVTAALLHFSGIGVYWLLGNGAAETKPPRIIDRPIEVGPPPSIPSIPVKVADPGIGKRFDVGTPVPVPIVEVDPERTFPTQEELSGIGGTVDGLAGEGTFELEQPPGPYVAVDIEPLPVKTAQPLYPEIARRAGMQGSVVVRVWVDKEGKVRKAEILKSDADIFNEPAVDAAMQWVFTPALAKSGPVSVWVSIPFRFTLH